MGCHTLPFVNWLDHPTTLTDSNRLPFSPVKQYDIACPRIPKLFLFEQDSGVKKMLKVAKPL